MRKITVTISNDEYVVAVYGNVRLVSNDILKIYSEVIQLTDGKLKAECESNDPEIKRDLLQIDDIVKSSKKYLKNHKHVRKTIQVANPVKKSYSKPVVGNSSMISLCDISNGYFRRYLQNNSELGVTIKSKTKNVKLSNGKTSWGFTIYCDIFDVSKAKKSIAAALPNKEGIPMAFVDRPLAWLT